METAPLPLPPPPPPRTSLNCTMLVWPDRRLWFRISRSTFLFTCRGQCAR
jgi:hypothetical protein